MIDTKELREKITIKGLDVVADTDILVVLDRLEAWENVFGHLGTPDEVGNEWRALSDRLEAAESEAIEQSRLNGMGAEREAALLAKLEAAEKERDALRAENERIDEAMESLLIRCDDSDSAMYGTLSTSFVRDTVRIARGALEESK